MTGIENVSDTARWVAFYRAMETERPDALFRDPYARLLAGEQGEAIVRAMPQGKSMAWPLIVRTAVFDAVVMECVRDRGVQMVVNLAAGLDARPWRLDLPADLRWVDVDLPGILGYKTAMLKDEPTRCRYEAVAADLTDTAVRAALFARLAGEARSALVLTEGLLIYLTPPDVAGLAAALHAHSTFQWWLTDLASPALIQRLSRTWGKQVAKGGAPFRFAPPEGSAYFREFGWYEERWLGTMEEAMRLRRGPWMMGFWKLMMRFAPERKREEFRRFSGYPLLKRCESGRSW